MESSTGRPAVRIERLVLRDYRNIAAAELRPAPGVNVIHGENAQGKTNLIEAVYLLTGQKSFRSCREADLVRFGAEQARIEAEFEGRGRMRTASLALGGKGRKTAELDGLAEVPSALTGEFLAVVFSPAELALVKDGPAERRAFLDSAISQIMPRYLKTLSSMNRALFQRNNLLSDRNRTGVREDMLEVWDKSFSRLAFSILKARARYVRRIAPKAEEIYSGISSGRERMSAVYQPTIPGDWENLDAGTGERMIFEALKSVREDDLRAGFTTVGPHRDDLDLQLDGISARSFGSQGQQRSCSLTLKLAECGVIAEVMGEYPIVLLDDVFSELDRRRREYFLSGIHSGQTFITSCDSTGLRTLRKGALFRVRAGEVQYSRPRGKSAAQEG